MTDRERDRIECAIRHIQTSVDVDPWAMEIAVDAMKEKISSSRSHENDTISRQDAIDEIDEWIKAFLENGHKESAADACLIQDGIIQLPSAQSDYEKIITEIKQCITETREHGKHHAKFVQDNGELYISGLEMALSIIEENR